MNLCFAFPTATSPRVSSELEQARPQTSGEEELQLQLALAMSREVAEQVVPRPTVCCPVPGGRDPRENKHLPCPHALQMTCVATWVFCHLLPPSQGGVLREVTFRKGLQGRKALPRDKPVKVLPRNPLADTAKPHELALHKLSVHGFLDAGVWAHRRLSPGQSGEMSQQHLSTGNILQTVRWEHRCIPWPI